MRMIVIEYIDLYKATLLIINRICVEWVCRWVGIVDVLGGDGNGVGV